MWCYWRCCVNCSGPKDQTQVTNRTALPAKEWFVPSVLPPEHRRSYFIMGLGKALAK